MYDIITIGEMLIDFTPYMTVKYEKQVFQQNPGGAPANVACVMARLGLKASFIGKVGKDQFGLACKNALRDAGVDTSNLILSDKHLTTLAFVSLDSGGNRDFAFYRNNTTADVNLTDSDIKEGIWEQAKVFHFGSVALTHEPAKSAILNTIERAKKSGVIISYDPNLRLPLWKSSDEAKSIILETLKYADILKLSDEEFVFLFGTQDEAHIAQKLKTDYNIKLLAITKGSKGSAIYHNGKVYNGFAYDVETIDTTGAGDSFAAGLLYHIIKIGKSIDQICDYEVSEMLDFSNALGSLVTTKKGAISAIPTIDEIEHCMKNTKKLQL